MNDLRFAVRRLWKQPGFTTIAVLTLALGIGATTTVFSVVNGVLIKPLPYQNPESLVGLWHVAPGVGTGEDVYMSSAQFFTYREHNRAFEEIGLWSVGAATITGQAEPEQVPALWVNFTTLPALGVRPTAGRAFAEHDDVAGAPGTVILTHDFWQRKYGGDPAAIGRTLMVDATPREVIGIMPKDFRFLNVEHEVVLPLRFDRSAARLGMFNFPALARLKPGVTLAQANADVARLIPIWLAAWPEGGPGFAKMIEGARFAPALRPLKEHVVGDIGDVLWVLMGTIGIVLLIACANVANLLLVRVEARRQELAVRAALGAGWSRIARELLIESLVLASIGGAAGLALTSGAIQLLVALDPSTLPRLHEIAVDRSVLLFATAASLLSSLLFAVIPIAKYAGPHIVSAVRLSGRTSSASRERHRARNALVVAQVALSLVLLAGSGLMIRTFVAMRAVEPGFSRPDQIQSVRLTIHGADAPDSRQALAVMDRIREQLASIPGVSAVAFARSMPMDGDRSSDILLTEDRTYKEGQLPPIRRIQYVSPGFFSTIGARLVAGRDFTWSELNNLRPVGVISEALAREMWREPGAAIGKRIREHPEAPWREIVGVVADIHDDGVHEKPPATVYWPIIVEQAWRNRIRIERSVAFAIRTNRAGTESFLGEMRERVWSVNRNLPLAQVRTLKEVYDRSMARTSFTLVMLAIAAAMALLLGVVGIYGVISYAVAQRTREIGIRVAVGAEQWQLSRMFVGHGLMLAGIGVVVGLAGAVATTRLIASMLFGVSPIDPVTYGSVSVVLVIAAAAASYLPARRAVRVDPLVALRYE